MAKKSGRNAAKKGLSRSPTETWKLELLEKILEESSSSALNTGTNYLSAKQALSNHTKLLTLIEELKEIESNTTPKLPERSDENWKGFFCWVDHNLKAYIEEPVSELVSVTMKENASNSRQEYSLVAKKLIDKNATIFSVPRQMMLTTETALSDPELARFIKSDTIASSMPNVTLVLHLLNEYSKSKGSFWWPYLSILPDKTLPVLNMNIDKLQSLTVSAHLFEFLKMIRAIARQYSYFYKRLQATNLPLNKDFTFQYYAWGVSMVCSRQNEIPPQLENSPLPLVLALIPVFDMCNHNYLSTKPIYENNRSLYKSRNVIQPGEEITINYGTRSSGEFYIHNGFVPQIVPHDFVPQTIGLSAEGSLYEDKAKLLGLISKPVIGTFKLEHFDQSSWVSRDPNLMLFLIVQCLNGQEVELIMQSEDPIGKLDEIFNPSATDSTGKVIDEETMRKLTSIRDRVYFCIREYLSKRASISILLIDRLLSERDKLSEQDALRLLEHEKTIYQSYLIKRA